MSRKFDRFENSVGGRIKAVRKMAGLTQSVFAFKIGIAKSSISEYEANKKTPPSRILKLISLTFGLNEEWLLTGQGEMACSPRDHYFVCCNENNADKNSLYSAQARWKVSDALVIAARVLESKTSYGDALYASIIHFDRALQAEDKIAMLEQRRQNQTRNPSAIKPENE
jgi:transcriptional regulator with XRE-family HTH domain